LEHSNTTDFCLLFFGVFFTVLNAVAIIIIF
jgi:hypothetical protein